MATNGNENDEVPDGRITAQILKTHTGEFDLESIHLLTLKYKGISELGCIGECTNLERLDLSFNDITKLFALAGLSRITYLNLSANRISNIEGLQSLDSLRELNLAGNLISSVDNLRCLIGLEHFEDLRLRDVLQGITNPMCMNNSYRGDVLNILPKLRNLDGERLRGKGSELFKALNEIEDYLNSRNGQGVHLEKMEPPSPWFQPGYFSSSAKLGGEFALEDAENQFRDLMIDCTRMLQEAAVKMNQMTKKPGAGDA